MTDIFHFHPETGELLGVSAADKDPLEPERDVIPAHATTVAPPAPQAGFARVFSGGMWTQIADHRGETWWNASGEAIVVSALGDPAQAGLANVAPAAPPASPPVPASITFRQFLIGLSMGGWITAAEALAWAARTALPALVENTISSMPEALQLPARITALALTNVYRDDALLAAALAAAMPTATEAERAAARDDAFRQWAEI